MHTHQAVSELPSTTTSITTLLKGVRLSRPRRHFIFLHQRTRTGMEAQCGVAASSSSQPGDHGAARRYSGNVKAILCPLYTHGADENQRSEYWVAQRRPGVMK